MTPIATKKRRADRLVRRSDGAYDWQAIQDGLFVKIEKLADKKRRKAAEKEKSKLRAEQNQRNSDIAENSAILARERLNMGKSSDIVTIAKSIISGGAASQPATTSKILAREIQKRADAMFADQPLSAPQRFARYTAIPDGEGATLLKASRRAVQEHMDSWDDEDEPDADAVETGTDPYKRMMAKADELRAANPHLTQAQLFSRLYSDPKNRRLADADKTAHFTKLAKHIGLR